MKHINATGHNLFCDLHFEGTWLSGFSFKVHSKLFELDLYNETNSLIMVLKTKYNGLLFSIRIYSDKDIMRDFSDKILLQYSNLKDERFVKSLLEEFLSSIDKLTDFRFNDIFSESKRLLRDNQIEVYLETEKIPA